MAACHITADRVRYLLSYDSETGVFRWRVSPGTRIKVGDVAGGSITRGYRMIRLDRVKYLAHRLAWLHVYGEWPDLHIDHINGVKDDNRICNLRAVSEAVNHQNIQGPRSDNPWGHVGVTHDPRSGRFRARIFVASKRHELGRFDTAEEASQAYLEAKRRLHPGCTI